MIHLWNPFYIISPISVYICFTYLFTSKLTKFNLIIYLTHVCEKNFFLKGIKTRKLANVFSE